MDLTIRSLVGSVRVAKDAASGSTICDMVFGGRHQPLRMWVLCLSFMGLNLPDLRIAQEPGLHPSDVQVSDAQVMASRLRADLTGQTPEVKLSGAVEADEVHVVASPIRETPRRSKKPPRAASKAHRLTGARGRGPLDKEEPPILGLIERGGHLVMTMLAYVQQKTIKPILGRCIETGSLIHTDEYDIHSWLRPQRGISQEKLPGDIGFFQFVHNTRKRGQTLLGARVGALLLDTKAITPSSTMSQYFKAQQTAGVQSIIRSVRAAVYVRPDSGRCDPTSRRRRRLLLRRRGS